MGVKGALPGGREVENSEALDKGVRGGLVAYGVVHLIVAWLAVQLVLGSGGENASQQGAFAQLAQQPFGDVILFLVAAGFAALVVWQVLEAIYGHRDSDGASRVVKRLASVAKAIVYAVLGFDALKTALGSGGGGGGSTQGMTAQVMSAPGGQLLVGAAGLAVVAVGVALCYRGIKAKFVKRLDVQGRSGDHANPIVTFGRVGYVGKGLSLAAVGALFVVAAVQHRPGRSGGLDAALHQLLQQPFGAVLVLAIALALACFGVYCFAWARHLRST
ncbi:MAG: hypothetical protein QOK15_1474 [Nocardioidaceae bacterium]|jgi:hypothetical protein|nr:hypothetical protein [Nocardioidaceae bacterium]